MTIQLAAELKTELDPIVAKYETKRAALLPVLNAIQKREGFISPEMEKEVADYLSLPLMQVREVMSFYTLFLSRPKGKYQFNVCQTMSCHLAGYKEILEYLKLKLGIGVGETSQDGKCSLSAVECLGACEIAPMMQLNEKYVGNLTRELIDDILNKLSL